MARILHVTDEPEWRDLARRALAGHRVDEAAGCGQALARLQAGRPYDLALVELDPGGAVLLHLLRAHYPDTRRVIATTAPVQGGLQASVIEKYGVEELLIRSETTVPGLRRVVEDTLGQRVSADARIRRAELWRRYREWRREQGAALDARVYAAEMLARNTGTAGSEARRRAEAALQDAVRLREQFRADADGLGARIAQAAEVCDTLDAADTFEQVEEFYFELVRP